MSIITYETLYERDRKGRIRFWFMDRDGNKYRSQSGLWPDGKANVSKWKEVKGKGKGKAATTDEQQAHQEIESKYEYRLTRTHHRDISQVDEPLMYCVMLAATYTKFPGAGYVQPKLDGMRCVLRRDGAWSRGGKPILTVAHIWDKLQAAGLWARFPNLTLDGELYNHEYAEKFEQLMSITRKGKTPNEEQLALAREVIQFHCYDVDLHDESTFEERVNFRDTILADYISGASVELVETRWVKTSEEMDLLYEEFLEKKYEGQMWRDRKGQYENDARPKTLLKRKEFMDEEFEVDEVLEGEGNWAGAAKSLVMHTKDGKTFNASLRGGYASGQKILAGPKPKTATVRFLRYSAKGVPNIPIVHAVYYEGDIEGRHILK